MKNTSFEMTENGIQMMCQIGINYCNKQQHGSDFDIDAMRQRGIGYVFRSYWSIFSNSYRISERRMQACEQNLFVILMILSMPMIVGILYMLRKDKTRGAFNIPSFNAMKDAVKALHRVIQIIL